MNHEISAIRTQIVSSPSLHQGEQEAIIAVNKLKTAVISTYGMITYVRHLLPNISKTH